MLLFGWFVFVGLFAAYLWCRWIMPHALDMCIGMLSFGNLGMLLGRWADNGFGPISSDGCCHCVIAGKSQPWMWLGMLAFANVAMIWFGQGRIRPNARHMAAMFSGGNLGMVLGMIVGGWCATQVAWGTMTAALFASFSAMTFGMLSGMLLGTWLVERFIGFTRDVRMISRRRVRDLSYE
jgi:hypothetical protein